MKKILTLLFALGLCSASQTPAAQVIPEYINYQGLLRDATGQPLLTGQYTIEFNIYTNANEGDKVWGPFLFDGNTGSPGHGLLVPVVDGTFNVIIGPKDTSGNSINGAFFGNHRFMEIKVATNGAARTAILPRQQFLTTAYAVQSQNADYATMASNLVQQVADVLCPPGSITAFGGSSNNIPSGWLLCDGRLLSTSSYGRLYGVITNYWGGTPGGATFNLPDLRGMFLRGVQGFRTTFGDLEATNRFYLNSGGNSGNAVGSYQLSREQDHKHRWGYYDESNGGQDLFSWDQAGAALRVLDDWSHNQLSTVTGSRGDDQMDTVNVPGGFWTEPTTNSFVGTETHPVNAYVNYIIKY